MKDSEILNEYFPNVKELDLNFPSWMREDIDLWNIW